MGKLLSTDQFEAVLDAAETHLGAIIQLKFCGCSPDDFERGDRLIADALVAANLMRVVDGLYEWVTQSQVKQILTDADALCCLVRKSGEFA